MWVQKGGPPGQPVVLFDYDPGRGAQVPLRLLHDYRGFLMTDGYDGYNQPARTDRIEHMACWAHVPPPLRRGRQSATQGAARFGRPGCCHDHGVERDCKDASDAQRLLAQQTHSVPALAALKAWLDKSLPMSRPRVRWARRCRKCATTGAA